MDNNQQSETQTNVNFNQNIDQYQSSYSLSQFNSNGNRQENYVEYWTAIFKNYAVTTAATSASLVATSFGYPFDSIKTRMQAFPYPSTMICIKETFKTEGARGFFRGLGPILLSVSTFRSIAFNLYHGAKLELHSIFNGDHPFFKSSLKMEGGQDRILRICTVSFLSGGVTGSLVAGVNAPFEFVKIQKQLARLNQTSVSKANDTSNIHPSINRPPSSVSSKPHSSSGPVKSLAPMKPANGAFQDKTTVQWMKFIVKNKGGFKGLFYGSTLHIARDGLGTAMYFCTYESIKYLLHNSHGKKNTSSSSWIHVIGGGFAGTFCWLFLFPIDLVKSVVQRHAFSHLQPTSHTQPTNNSFLESHNKQANQRITARSFIREAWKEGGIKRFYSGIGPQLIRSFPVHALNFFVYEKVIRLCGGKEL